MKMKTHSGAKKRLKLTGSGKVKHKKPFRRHLLSFKPHKRKRQLRATAYIGPSNQYQVDRLLCL